MRRNMPLLAVGLFLVLLSGCGLITVQHQDDIVPIVVYEDKVVIASFVKTYEDEFYGDSCFIQMNFENKLDRAIIILPKNCAVNGVEAEFRSMNRNPLAPEASRDESWLLVYEDAGITSVSDMETITFRLRVVDAEGKILSRGRTVTLDLLK